MTPDQRLTMMYDLVVHLHMSWQDLLAMSDEHLAWLHTRLIRDLTLSKLR